MQKILDIILAVLNVLIPSFKDPNSAAGIKETKEAVIGLNEIALVLANRFKDGVQITDFTVMWDKLQNDAEFKAKLEAAWNNYKLIPAEVKDIDLSEGGELVIVQIGYLPKFIDEFKKNA